MPVHILSFLPCQSGRKDSSLDKAGHGEESLILDITMARQKSMSITPCLGLSESLTTSTEAGIATEMTTVIRSR